MDNKRSKKRGKGQGIPRFSGRPGTTASIFIPDDVMERTKGQGAMGRGYGSAFNLDGKASIGRCFFCDDMPDYFLVENVCQKSACQDRLRKQKEVRELKETERLAREAKLVKPAEPEIVQPSTVEEVIFRKGGKRIVKSYQRVTREKQIAEEEAKRINQEMQRRFIEEQQEGPTGEVSRGKNNQAKTSSIVVRRLNVSGSLFAKPAQEDPEEKEEEERGEGRRREGKLFNPLFRSRR